MYENILENLPVIDFTEALELVGDEKELLQELLNSFVEDKKLNLSELKNIEEKNLLEAASYVHYFKGAGRQLCMKRLAQSGQLLEDVLRGKAEGNIEELNLIFYNEYNEALKSAQAYISN